MDKKEHIFPTLICDDIRGNKKIWMARVFTEETDSIAYSEIQFGRQNGKLQRAVVEYTLGKNIGKANETTPYQQCFLETERKWKNQQKKQYVYEGMKETEEEFPVQEECVARILPMLAKTWTFPKGAKPKKSDIVFPCFVQPKLDGLRCLVFIENGRMVCQSRTSGEFNGLDHITDQLQKCLGEHPSWVLDGELYTDEIPFEVLVGLIKRKTHTDSVKKVNYHVYDIYDRDRPQASMEERVRWLFECVVDKDEDKDDEDKDKDKVTPSIKPVETILVQTPDAVLEQFHVFIEQGHEGIMLRNRDAPYIPNHRSHHLQKYKEFMEEEYPIVGFTSGVGKYANCVIWSCSYNDDGATFQVIPRGTIEQKREWFLAGNEHIGKKLTVIYQQKMESGCPRFPIGKAIREDY